MSEQQFYAVLIPLDGEALLLPNAAVAEVVARDRVRPPSAAPEWLAGHVEWNNRRIPVLRFETLNGAPASVVDRRERVVIVHSLGVHHQGGALGFITLGYPHLVTLNRAALKAVPLRAQDRNDLVLSRVRIASQEAVIPDLETIEADLARVENFAADTLA